MNIKATGSTENFLGSIGVNTHLGASDTGYGNIDQVISQLEYIGVTRVRDGLDRHLGTSMFEVLASQGVTFSMLTSGTNGATISDQMGAIEKLELLYDAVDYVEGPNETDYWSFSYEGLPGFAATRAFQADLYSAVHASDVLNGDGNSTPVIQTSLGDGSSYTSLGNLSASADYSNIHSYYFGYNYTVSVADQIAGRIEQAQIVSPGKETIATEGGWSTAVNDREEYGVSENVQAILTLNMLLDQYKAGVDVSYIYQLLNEGTWSSNDLQAGFGLFNADGSAKPVAEALHNLNTILSDFAADTPLGSLNYSLQNMPGTGKEMLLQESSENFDLVLWNEPVIWNAAADAQYAIANQVVTVNFDVAQSGKIYDPMQGNSAIATFTDAKSIQVNLSDHPLVVEVGTVAARTPVVETTGNQDTITFHVSGDAYKGDAQFLVRVDDVVLGDVQTITASHAAGETQEITFQGDFSAGLHKVSVTFLNDLNGWSAGDRNMYVEGITVGDSLHGEATASMKYSYTADFDLMFS